MLRFGKPLSQSLGNHHADLIRIATLSTLAVHGSDNIVVSRSRLHALIAISLRQRLRCRRSDQEQEQGKARNDALEDTIFHGYLAI